jgi:transcriptional regulator with XRE-family HTH domain
MGEEVETGITEKEREEIRHAFGRFIREKRLLLNISQEALADQSGLHWTYVSNIENGKPNISLEKIFCLASALHCSAEELIPDIEKKTRNSTKSQKKKKEIQITDKALIQREFGQLIKERRLSLKISQDEFAFASALHRTYVSSIERGERNISLENIFLLAKALRCHARDLIPSLQLKLRSSSKYKEKPACISEKVKRSLQKEFGKKVKEQRLSKGISQEELAFRSGLHRTYVGAIERGQENISLTNVYMLAQALECQARELIPIPSSQMC